MFNLEIFMERLFFILIKYVQFNSPVSTGSTGIYSNEFYEEATYIRSKYQETPIRIWRA